MTDIPLNRLWAMATSPKAMNIAQTFDHHYCNDDHCLVISPERPEGAREVDEKLLLLLTAEDLCWIYREADRIREEQQEKYRREWEKCQKDFLAKFEANLKERQEMSADGRTEQS